MGDPNSTRLHHLEVYGDVFTTVSLGDSATSLITPEKYCHERSTRPSKLIVKQLGKGFQLHHLSMSQNYWTSKMNSMILKNGYVW